jgi:hypothetical protein
MGGFGWQPWEIACDVNKWVLESLRQFRIAEEVLQPFDRPTLGREQ